MNESATVSMDRFWNIIAIPYFFIVMAFGIFVLFRVGNVQLVSTKTISGIAHRLRRAKPLQGSSVGPQSPV